MRRERVDMAIVNAASTAPQDLFRVAVWQKPWRSQLLLASPETTGFSPRLAIERPADVGELAEALPPGAREGRVDRSNAAVVDLFDTEAQSISRLQLLNGANAAACCAANSAPATPWRRVRPPGSLSSC